jgi:methionyl aminopeptidase
MRYAGKVNLAAIEWGFHHAQPGTTLAEIDAVMEKYIRDAGCRPAFKNYQPEGYPLTYLYTACLSVNDVAVHGLPSDYKLMGGDLLTIDVGTRHGDYFVDSARSRVLPVITRDERQINAVKARNLVRATEAILDAQLQQVRHNCNFLTMIHAAEDAARQYGVNICPHYGGHGIGKQIHMEPFIPSAIDRSLSSIRQNIEEKFFGRIALEAGKTYCVEPVVMLHSTETYIDTDGWTVRTKDGGLAAHTERTILITETGHEVLA